MLSRLGYRLIDGLSALRAVCVAFANAGTATGADQPDTGLQMLNCYCALAEINIVNGNPQSLGNPASQPGQKPDQELISEAPGFVTKPFYLLTFQICFHSQLTFRR